MAEFAKSTLLIATLTGLGLALNFGVNLATAAAFGVGPAMDAYLAATTLPNFVNTILGTSLATTFLPIYTEYRGRDPKEAWKIAGAFMNFVALAGVAVCALGTVFAAPLMRMMAPGLSALQQADAVSMMIWLLPLVVLTGVNQVLSGAYYSHGRFLAPLLIRVISPAITLLSLALLARNLGERSLVLAALAANLLQTALLLTGIARRGLWGEIWNFEWRHPAIGRILRLMLPLALGMCFYKLAPVIERGFASSVAPGAISLVSYATRLSGALQPLLVSGLSLSGFVLMSRYAAEGDRAALRSVLKRGCGLLLFASVPLALFLCAFGKPLVALAFERGAFTPQDTLDTYRLFALYILVLPASTAGTLIGQAFYAFQDTRTPLAAGLLDVLLFVGLLFALAPALDLAALPASYLVAYYATTLLICVRLSRKTGFSVPRMLLRPFLKSLGAALPALACGWILYDRILFSATGALACLAAAGAIYLALQKWMLRSEELELLLDLARRGMASITGKGRP